ncbi:PadR family transcriptional regulator [Sutcliffiella halmapala]|uniref:PadR family transcriptional regulator n=1 Tax=Sutcliffiella halmapala TaxID=79882 RepID=UPI00099517B0|nr:PadR family transcriptional regulator [Sutcliffiella halmapala]
MSKENNTVYAILGLLTTGCVTGYSIKQMIDGSLNHFWKISYGQIYPTLKHLVDKGYATVKETVQEGKPAKKEYMITLEGEQALKGWLQNTIEELPIEKNELLLKLFFCRHQDHTQTVELLDTYLEKLTERFETYTVIKEHIHSHKIKHADARFWIMTLDYGLYTTKAAMDWCNDTKEKIANE